MKLRYESLLPFYHWMWKHWRARRWKRFLMEIQPMPSDLILDVGGNPSDWADKRDAIPRIDLLNLAENKPLSGANHPEMLCMAGDGRALPFTDASYDIVYSNSVIEHVGEIEQQEEFARELSRVGKRLWIQTPAWECPVEPHYLGLFFHWLPRRWHILFARWFSVVGLTKAADLESIATTTRLIRKREFRQLFPDCRILTERFLFVFPKSYIAVRRIEKEASK